METSHTSENYNIPPVWVLWIDRLFSAPRTHPPVRPYRPVANLAGRACFPWSTQLVSFLTSSTLEGGELTSISFSFGCNAGCPCNRWRCVACIPKKLPLVSGARFHDLHGRSAIRTGRSRLYGFDIFLVLLSFRLYDLSLPGSPRSAFPFRKHVPPCFPSSFVPGNTQCYYESHNSIKNEVQTLFSNSIRRFSELAWSLKANRQHPCYPYSLLFNNSRIEIASQPHTCRYYNKGENSARMITEGCYPFVWLIVPVACSTIEPVEFKFPSAWLVSGYL